MPVLVEALLQNILPPKIFPNKFFPQNSSHKILHKKFSTNNSKNSTSKGGNKNKKTCSISPLFYTEIPPPPPRKEKSELGACPCRGCHRMMMRDVPPRPTPFPLPSKAPTFGASGRCQGWGREGARAGLVLGMITPPLPPFPWHYFLRGRAKGRGVKGGPTMPDLPRPLPHHSTQAPCSLLKRHGFPGWSVGGRGRYGVPTPTLPPTNLT